MTSIKRPTFVALAVIAGGVFSSSKAYAWITEGRWSTARFNCSGNLVKIGVDMNTKIGGGDYAPVRTAYMNINGKAMEAVWMVGASMDSVQTNNRNYTLVTNSSSGTYLQSIGARDKTCSPAR